MTVHHRDPFEYKLRSKEELRKEQEKHPPDFSFQIIITDYVKVARTPYKDKSRKIIIEMDMKKMMLTKLQKARLIQLLGTRYKRGSDKFRIQCDAFGTWEDNLAKTVEMAKELYWEAKRAP